MRVSILYFSQTGNTYRVAQCMAETLAHFGHSILLVPIDAVQSDRDLECDLIGIGSPCFNSRAPLPVRTFIDSLPVREGQESFVFATCGGAPGKVLVEMAGLLRQKGRDVGSGLLIRGEVHHPAPSFIGRYPGRPDAADFDRVRTFVKASLLHLPGFDPTHSARRHTSRSQLKDFYSLIANLHTTSMTRRLMPQPRLQSAQCDDCGWCAENCPTENIVIGETLQFGDRCIRCYRCVSGCPLKAITIDWTFKSSLVQSLYAPSLIKRFGDLHKGEQIY